MRLIDADALSKKLLEELHNRSMHGFGKGLMIANSCVINAPTIEERKTGRWVRTGRTNVFGGFEVACSNCHDTVMITHLDDELFCRHCGAKMEG